MGIEKFIEIQRAEMVFHTKKGNFHALADVSLSVAKGEFITLIGHSGCGKSTLLNLIAGLTTASEGMLLCGGREIAGPSPERGVVFQNHSLLPWLSCYENVHLAVERVFGARESGLQLKERVMQAFAHVAKGPVQRYELPKLRALNFVIEGALGGGVTRSLAQDAHGKSFSSLMLTIELPG